MTRSADAPELFSPASLAAYLDVPIATVYTWNYQGSGPRPLHVGRHVRYRRDDVEKWLDAQGPTS